MALDPQHRSDPRPGLLAVVRPEPAGVARPHRGQRELRPAAQGPRRPAAQPVDPAGLPAGLALQGGGRRPPRSAAASTRPHDRDSRPRGARPARDDSNDQQLRRRALSRRQGDPDRGAGHLVQHRLRQDRARPRRRRAPRPGREVRLQRAAGHPAGRGPQHLSRTISTPPRPLRAPSVSTTSGPRRCRWPWSGPASPTTAW